MRRSLSLGSSRDSAIESADAYPPIASLEIQRMSIRRPCLVAASVVIITAGCSTETPTHPAGNARTVENAETALPPCGSCSFGPRLYLREGGKPANSLETFQGDPAADYVIDIDDYGSEGADGSVVLNGEEIL